MKNDIMKIILTLFVGYFSSLSLWAMDPPNKSEQVPGTSHYTQLSDGVHKRIFNEESMIQFMSSSYDILSKVQSLNLFGSDVTDKGLKYLSNLPHLELLNLGLCQKITNNGLEYLTHLKNLKVLSLCGSEGITGEALKCLIHIQSLKVICNKFRMVRYGSFPPVGYMTGVTENDDLLEITRNPSKYGVMIQKMSDNSGKIFIMWPMFG